MLCCMVQNIDLQKTPYSTDMRCDNATLHWICSHIRRDRVQNDDIHDRLEVALSEEKLVQH
jgi:hypothetical protein